MAKKPCLRLQFPTKYGGGTSTRVGACRWLLSFLIQK
ncbi:hypothetical protein T01_2945 [Trichinella spiralis]|uniref:Uncharacterized protein n=1 Tax=Trichinella spiralis TaxID=6334 RepID=A0A0V1BDA7_TRISP|nr:hypothetical protein T01_2945 [Trichinella spiralis]